MNKAATKYIKYWECIRQIAAYTTAINHANENIIRNKKHINKCHKENRLVPRKYKTADIIYNSNIQHYKKTIFAANLKLSKLFTEEEVMQFKLMGDPYDSIDY